jgi:hypothetical protein
MGFTGYLSPVEKNKKLWATGFKFSKRIDQLKQFESHGRVWIRQTCLYQGQRAHRWSENINGNVQPHKSWSWVLKATIRSNATTSA